MGQLNEAVDRCGVQNVGSLGRVRFAVVLAPVQTAHCTATFAHNQRAVFGLGKDFITGQHGIHKGNALAGKLWVTLHDLPTGRTRGVHPLIVQHNGHA